MKFEIYKAKDGSWRWRLRARNGRIIAAGSEGYARKAQVEKIVESITAKIEAGGYGMFEVDD